MKIRFIYILMFFNSCSQSFSDTWNSDILISSEGEKIYINSLTWGVTGDSQLSIVSKSRNRVKERSDTVGTAKGIDPFIYTFNNDTLTLYFNGLISYRIKDSFNSIEVKYVSLDPATYMSYMRQANEVDKFSRVPKNSNVSYPSDMPKPPKID